jgi:hypothetical protein
MEIDNLTIGDVKKLAAMFGGAPQLIDNGMIGKYVIVRCRDAGVHSGILESHNGRECVLTESRRLWYWKTAKGAFLSSAAMDMALAMAMALDMAMAMALDMAMAMALDMALAMALVLDMAMAMAMNMALAELGEI